MAVTIKDVARVAGVSISTVSRSLNDSPLVTLKTKEKVKKVAEELKFEINASARTMITKKTDTIGIIYPEEIKEFDFSLYHISLLNNLRDVLEKEDLDTIVTFHENKYTKKSSIYKLISKQKVDALLIINEKITQEEWDYIKDREFPCVFLHYIPRLDILDEIDVIATDNFYGGKLATEYLISLGHKKILCVSKESDEFEYKKLIEGYKFVVKEYGLDLGEESIVKIKFSPDGIKQFISENIDLIKSKTAIFVQNDLGATNFINELKFYGIRVPEDISIIGYDDVDGLEYFNPGLTTIHQPKEIIAKMSCERLVELLKDENITKKINIMVKPRLVVRSSCIRV